MTVPPDALRRLHRIHRQLADLKGRLQRGPAEVHAAQQAVERSEKQLEDAKQRWKQTRMASDNQQMQLKEREAKVKDLQRKLNECRDNKEFKILKDQIAAEKQANSVLEDEILDKLVKLDEIQEQIRDAEQQVAKARERLEQVRQRVEGERSKLESERDRVAAELEQAESELPADFKQNYDRVIRAHGERGLSPVDGESCSNCHTVLTAQTMNELYLGKLVFCKSCGCLLYLAEDRIVGRSSS